MTVTVVTGNPKPDSRTLAAATLLATKLSGAEPDRTIDVITLGAGLLGWGDPTVAAAVESVATSRLAVVASPTFKATYAGVLKLFLDQFATGDGLAGVVVVPLMLGARPMHAMAPDLLLKPVLVEIGATCPAPGLYLNDESYAEDSVMDTYVARWRPLIEAVQLPVGAP
jgi:FMN reductase